MRCNETERGSYAHFGKVCSWSWDCGNHGDHPGRFVKGDFQGFTYALSQAVQMMNTAGAKWVGALCLELGQQYGYVNNGVI